MEVHISRFGEGVRQGRIKLGISQTELAKLCGTTQATICKIERRNVDAGITVGIKLISILKLRVRV